MKYRYQEIPCALYRHQHAVCDEDGRPFLRTVDYHKGSDLDLMVEEFLKGAVERLSRRERID